MADKVRDPATVLEWAKAGRELENGGQKL